MWPPAWGRRASGLSMAGADRVALVTGSAHGIGAAIAAALAAEGLTVHGVDRDECDVSDAAAVTALVAALGRVDVLVISSGRRSAGQVGRLLEDVSDDDWRAGGRCQPDEHVRVHPRGRPRHEGAPLPADREHLLGRGACSVSLTGIQAHASAKAGQLGFTRQTAHELGPYGITVNAIAPGFVLSNPTSIAQWESYGEAGQAAVLERIALRRLGEPEDIAEGVVFLVRAKWLSGQVISIDGGSALV